METTAPKATLFSAIKPSGELTLGSYLGAIANWTRYIEDYNSILCIADMHTITVRIPPAELRKNTMTQLAYYIACGIEPEKCVLFVQSHVSAHAELAWILGCYTMFGELSRMTQFKDKSAKNEENINAGLFTYPVLMAADILLYNADIVPVGDDQRQHVELCRDIAARFNSVYGETFTLPKTVLPPVAARVMSLSDPASKMSKSEGADQGGCVFLTDRKDDIVRKFKRAVTDSEAAVYYDEENKKGISNLMAILSAVSGDSFDKITADFAGKGYGDFKLAVAEAVCDTLAPIQAKADALLADKTYLEGIYKTGAAQAERLGRRMMHKVFRKVGFAAKPRD